MLPQLNDDCWYTICSFLDTQSKVALYFTSSYHQEIVKQHYKTHKSVWINTTLWQYFYENEDKLKNFLDNVSPNLTQLGLDGISSWKFHLLENIKVPKVTTFTLALARNMDLQSQLKMAANFHKLMSGMSENLVELMLQGIGHELLYAIGDLTFPKLKHCGLLLRRVNYMPGNIHEADLALKTFPNVTKLLLLTDSIGQNMWQLKNLTELNLIHCYNFVGEYLAQVFRELKLRKFVFKPFDGFGCYESEDYFSSIGNCQSLEELSVEYHHLAQLVNELPKLRNLRSLTFTPKESCFCHYKPERHLMPIAKHFGIAMESLVFTAVPFNVTQEDYLPFLESMKNLRCLILNESNPSDEVLLALSRAAGATLQEFRFVHSAGFVDVHEGLKAVLANCKNLKIFDLSSTGIDLDFLKEALEILRGNFKNRLEPLVVHLHNTATNLSDLKLLNLPDFVKVNLEKPNFKHGTRETILCEWKTNTLNLKANN